MKPFALAMAAGLSIAAGDLKTETEHVVASGETLRSIAARAGVPVAAIAEANGMMEAARVRKGQRLIIPRQHRHIVKRGDTPFAIAYQYGVSWDQIAIANGLGGGDRPRPGQTLIVPALLAQPPAPVAASHPAFQRPYGGIVLSERGAGKRDAIDFAAATGDRVVAAAAGKVIYAGEEPTRFGNLVVIDHGNGWATAYGYLSRVTVKNGDEVAAGERVGLAGKTGEAARPEVHFEIRRAGRPVDPEPLLATRAAR